MPGRKCLSSLYILLETYTIVKAVYYCYRFTKMDGAGGYSGTGEEGAGGAQRNPQNQAAQKRLQQTQAKVDEVPACSFGWFRRLQYCDALCGFC